VTPTPVSVRIVAAIGIGLVFGALVYALTSGHVFLFPFLLLLGFPMAAVFRPRRPVLPSGDPPAPEPRSRISLN
jgi:hypothetical protein